MVGSKVIKSGQPAAPAAWTNFRRQGGQVAPREGTPAGARRPQVQEVPPPAVLAQRLLAAARSEAEGILAAAAAETASLHAEAVEQGRREGAAAGRAEATGLLDEARRVLDEAWQERRGIIAGAVDDAVELALDLARRVVGRELQSDPEEVLDLARRLLRDAPDGPVVLRAHPVDAAHLEGRRDLLGEQARVQGDSGLSVGDLVVETSTGTLEATLAGRIARMEAAVREAAARGD